MGLLVVMSTDQSLLILEARCLFRFLALFVSAFRQIQTGLVLIRRNYGDATTFFLNHISVHLYSSLPKKLDQKQQVPHPCLFLLQKKKNVPPTRKFFLNSIRVPEAELRYSYRFGVAPRSF